MAEKVTKLHQTHELYGESFDLKQNCGLVAQDGQLLSSNPTIDGAYFHYYHPSRYVMNEQFLLLIAKLQQALQQKDQPLLQIDDYGHFPEEGNRIGTLIDINKLTEDVKIMFDSEEQIGDISRDEWLNGLKSLGGLYGNEHIFNIDSHDKQITFSANEKEVYRDSFCRIRFGFYNDLCSVFKSGCFKDHSLIIHQLAANETFFRVRSDLLTSVDQNRTYWNALGFETEPTDISELDDRYLAYRQHIHPDYVADEFKAEARILFCYITQAYRITKATMNVA